MALVELTTSSPTVMHARHLLRAIVEKHPVVSLGFDHVDIGERIPLYEHEITVLSYIEDGLLSPAFIEMNRDRKIVSAPLDSVLEDLVELGLVKEENGRYKLDSRARRCTYTVVVDVPSEQPHNLASSASPFCR
ncbi:hypothetical protein HY493_00780 [Candidatus Woesearchaeota archaeon]|nr:hypothetical protein [Candidatus Woesearchaeota archaeon]